MSPRLEAGWLIVPCNAHDRAQVYVDPGDGEWRPGFRATVNGTRVAKCRPSQYGKVDVRLKVDERVTSFQTVVI